MTDETMYLRSLVDKSADADLLREMIGFGVEKLMELEVGAKRSAAYGEKNGMMQQRSRLASAPDRHDQCIGDELGRHARIHRPADDTRENRSMTAAT